MTADLVDCTETSEFVAAYAAFQKSYPSFESTKSLDELRVREYGRLDRLGQVYLDYTGGGLYAESQVRQHLDLLLDNVYGNPHSANPTSLAATRLVEQTRAYVLEYFNASPDEYQVIFTPNATGALKLVGESYPFGPGDHYLLTFDNHNSVNGIREFAKARGAQVTYVPVLPPDLRVDLEPLVSAFTQAQIAGLQLANNLSDALGNARSGGHNLFAFPAQSNFSGVQHPLEWIAEAQAVGWDVLLDAAAFVPTNRLDLGRWHPDYVDVSFYKIFGYPTGLGCLIARRPALAKLRRPWYAGGTITFSTVVAANDSNGGFSLIPGPAGFEDGTVNYLGIPAIEIGLRHVAAIGIDLIHERVQCLTGWLLNQLATLRHRNGRPLVRVYGPLDCEKRGGTIALSFHDPVGRLVDCYLIERRANEQSISLRSGCHCNPGGCEVALGYDKDQLQTCFHAKDRMTFEQFAHVIDGNTNGAVRVSLGLATTFADVYRFQAFCQGLLNKGTGEI